jgi:hypothetical protein
LGGFGKVPERLPNKITIWFSVLRPIFFIGSGGESEAKTPVVENMLKAISERLKAFAAICFSDLLLPIFIKILQLDYSEINLRL